MIFCRGNTGERESKMLSSVLYIMAASAIISNALFKALESKAGNAILAIATCFGLGYALVSGNSWLLLPGILFGFCLVLSFDNQETQNV